MVLRCENGCCCGPDLLEIGPFEKAVAAWWIGRKNESLELLHKLDGMQLNPGYAKAVKNNLERLAHVDV